MCVNFDKKNECQLYTDNNWVKVCLSKRWLNGCYSSVDGIKKFWHSFY